MIKIKIGDPIKLKPTPLSPKSGFISFPYDGQLVEYIKSLGNRVYLPELKMWEVPLTAVPTICNKLTTRDIEIVGEMVKETKTQVQLPKDFAFTTQPYSHQLEGVLFGLEEGTFLLGDEQGLGKTKQIIDLAIARKHLEGMKHCLIICGVNGNKYNWVDEVHTHSKEDAWIIGTRYTKKAPVKMIEGTSKDKLDDLMNLPPHFFLITNIETLRAMPTKKGNKIVFPIAERIQKLCDMGEIGIIALDEAHKVKNPTSQQGKALLSIKPKYAIPMSGTFLVNSPLDLYVPLKWAGFEQHSFYQYKQHYCVMGGFNNQEIIGYKNLDEIRALLDKVMIRRTKDDVLDLPPKIHTIEYVEMSKEQKMIYDEVKKEIKSNIDKLRISNDPLAQMIRLRQATGYPGILSSTITQSAKMDRLEELIEEITSVGQKAIVYSQWEQMTRVMRQKLKKYNPAYITGEVKADVRMQEVERFQTDPTCKVIIGTIGAMGTGLTLTAASNVIFIDEPWNRALKDQAEDRAHRVGTKGTVRVITIVCKNTIDERIMNLVYRKGKMADMLIDGKFEVKNKAAFIDYLLS